MDTMIMKNKIKGLLKSIIYIQCRNINSLIPKSKTSYKVLNIIPTERTLQRREWFPSKGKRPPLSSKYSEKKLHINVSLENDPLKLANYIRRLLMKDRYDLAVKTVRTVSRSIQCVVSWNHLIDWLMSKGKMKSAFKIYHEVCKLDI